MLILSSCGTEIKDTWIEKKVIVTKKIKEKKLTVSEKQIIDIKTNLDKLKNVELSEMDLDMINSGIVNLYNQKMEIKALDKNDIKICDNLDKDNIDNCKKRFFIASNNIKWCDLLKSEDMQRICKNRIIEKKASKEFDEKICEKMTFQKQEWVDWGEDMYLNMWKQEIDNCKNRIFIEKAIVKKDVNICKNISTKNEQNNCEDFVGMELNNK